MDVYISKLAVPLATQDGEELGRLLSTTGRSFEVQDLIQNVGDCSRQALSKYKGSIAEPWDDITIALIQVVTNIMDSNYKEAYLEQAILVNSFLRFFSQQTRWAISGLCAVLHDLRIIAAKAQDEAKARAESSDALEDAARLCNKGFTACVNDRTNKLQDSRKWGTYRLVVITVRSYMKVERSGLYKSLLRALSVADIPQLSQFPRAHQVSAKYYFGLWEFLNEDYANACENFSFAFANCPRSEHRHQELILTYLIPLQLLRGRLPSKRLLEPFPRLAELYTPFVYAIKTGNVKEFDRLIAWAEPRLQSMHVWLCMENVREFCLRGLLKNVWRALNKPTRLLISEMQRALALSALPLEAEEVECIIANLIFKGHVKGYISHEKQTVVLAARDTFPAVAMRAL